MAPSLRAPKPGILSVAFLHGYLVTMRPYLLFVSGITGIAGLSLASSSDGLQSVLIALASFLAYGFGQALTDCFQVDTDRLSAPYRPLTRGAIGRGRVLGVSVVGLVLCVAAFAAAHPANLLLGALAALGLATYTPFKRRWWGGPWYNAWIVAVLCLMAFLAGARPGVVPSALAWTLAAVFLGYANFVLAGYFKDVEADRSSGYDTLPVVYGHRVAARVSDAVAAAALAALLGARLSLAPGREQSIVNLLSWALVLAAAGLSLCGQRRLHATTDDATAYRAIGPVVTSYVAGLAGLASAARPGWSVPLLGFSTLFLVVLWARPSRSQI